MADSSEIFNQARIETWGNDSDFCPGGLITVQTASGDKKEDGNRDRLLCVALDVNTWGVPVAQIGIEATARAVATGVMTEENLRPMSPSIHLNAEQWEQFKAAGDAVFA